MKSRYIKFFKKELVFLLLLLIVVFISFGITYANFIYNSDDKRAVEMFTGSLDCNIKINNTYQNNINVSKGSSIITLELESLNEVSSYYKLLTNSNLTIYAIEGYTSGAIGSNEKVTIKLYVVNNSSEDKNISFVVAMGYITNKLDDVIIKDGYHEISLIKNEITYDKKKWLIKSINEDASITLISKDVTNTKLSGYNAYNNINDLLNSKCTTTGSRSVSIFDIEGLNIAVDNEFTTINRLVYFPTSFKSEPYVSIDNSVDEEGYSYSNKVLVRKTMIDANINNDLFKQGKYLLNTNYYEVNNNEIYYYALELNDGKVNLRKLYDSNNTDYEITSGVKCIVSIKDIAF